MTFGDGLFRAVVAGLAFGLLFVVCLVAQRLSQRPSGGVVVERGERTARRRREAALAAGLMFALSAVLAAPAFLWPGVAVSVSAVFLGLAMLAPVVVLVRIAASRPAVLLGGWVASALVVAGASWWIGGSMVAAADVPGRLEQEATMVAVRRIGEAFERWRSDHGLPSARGLEAVERADPGDPAGSGGSPAEAGVVELEELPLLRFETLAGELVPDYVSTLPRQDGWGHPLELRGALGATPRLAVRSPGSDGRFSADRYRDGEFDPAAFAEDIVWLDGLFVREPAS